MHSMDRSPRVSHLEMQTMVKHYNPSLAETAYRKFNFKSNEAIGAEVEGLLAVVPIQPIQRICRRGSAANATSVTIFTTPTDKDFYLTSAVLTVIKDVTSTSTSSAINVTIDGVAVQIIDIAGITLTVQNEAANITFAGDGIKVDRGTNITVTNSSNVANIRASACIHGYTQETTAN